MVFNSCYSIIKSGICYSFNHLTQVEVWHYSKQKKYEVLNDHVVFILFYN